MKYSQWIGILAGITLVIACFLPWAFYPDLNKNFTGFYSENNAYGKPGRVYIVLVAVTTILYDIPRLWAKRTNLFIIALILAYSIKNFIVFSGCYRGICPDKKIGLWMMLAASVVMLIMAL